MSVRMGKLSGQPNFILIETTESNDVGKEKNAIEVELFIELLLQSFILCYEPTACEKITRA